MSEAVKLPQPCRRSSFPGPGPGAAAGGAALLLALLGACTQQALPGCAQEAAGCVATTAQESRVWQGRVWQGRVWQGTVTAATTVTAARLGGQPVESLHLEGTALVGRVGGVEKRGADLVGATLVQREADGALFDTTVTQVERDPADASGETLLYSLTAVNPSTGAVESFCQADSAGAAQAIPVSGSWDETGAHTPSSSVITFGCTRGVIAKCIRWGYKPWKQVAGRSLQDYHQACTRMARADYCGDGVTHTEEGTEIDAYDDLGIQQRTPLNLLSPMLFEAAWSPQGAYCIQKERWLKLLTLPSFTCASRFSLSLPTVSPVDPRDLCLAVRPDLPASSVHLDNQSGLNVRRQ